MSENQPPEEPAKPDPARPRADMVDLEERLEDLLIAAGKQAGKISEELGVEPVNPDAPKGIPVDPSPAGVKAAPSVEAQLSAIDNVVKTAATELGATRERSASAPAADAAAAAPPTVGAQLSATAGSPSAGSTGDATRTSAGGEAGTAPSGENNAAPAAVAASNTSPARKSAAEVSKEDAPHPESVAADGATEGQRSTRAGVRAVLPMIVRAIAQGLHQFDRLFRWVPTSARGVIGYLAVATLIMAVVAWGLALVR